jgi:MFS transporter, SHS family, lactate transporter
MPQSAPTPTHHVPTREAAAATVAGFLGWTLDAFDFFLVVMCTKEIAQEFGVTDAKVTASITLTLMFRPVGALIFGLLADRYGRRIPMIIDLVFYSAVEVATGFATNLTAFFVLRALFGIGMGGEWGVGASLVMEKVPARYRGLLSGLLQEGYAAGYLLAAVVAYFMPNMRGAFGGWDPHGWRWMFMLGGLPAILALFIRLFIKESEVWEKNKAESWSHLGRGIVSHWKLWIYLTIFMTMMNSSSHGTQDKYKALLSYRSLDTHQISIVIIVGMVGAILGGMLFGFLSDRLGRRRMMIGAFVGALVSVSFWSNADKLSSIYISAFMMQFCVQGAWGIVPAHINELAPTKVRGFLPGFAYQCGNLISSPIPLIQATLAQTHEYPAVMGISAAIIFIVAIVVVGAGQEKRGVHFGVDEPNRCACGYDLAGLSIGVCPECGRTVTTSAPASPSRS